MTEEWLRLLKNKIKRESCSSSDHNKGHWYKKGERCLRSFTLFCCLHWRSIQELWSGSFVGSICGHYNLCFLCVYFVDIKEATFGEKLCCSDQSLILQQVNLLLKKNQMPMSLNEQHSFWSYCENENFIKEYQH